MRICHEIFRFSKLMYLLFSSPHHAATEVGLDLLWLSVSQIQHVKFGFSAFQNSLAVQHSLLKVSRFLEQLELGTNLTELPLNRTEVHSNNIFLN